MRCANCRTYVVVEIRTRTATLYELIAAWYQGFHSHLFYFKKLILSLKRNIQRPRTTWPGTKFDFLMETRYTSSTVLFWVTYSCLKIDLMQFSFQLCLQKYRVIFWYLCRSVWKCLSLIHPGRACLRRSVFCGTKENLERNKRRIRGRTFVSSAKKPCVESLRKSWFENGRIKIIRLYAPDELSLWSRIYMLWPHAEICFQLWKRLKAMTRMPNVKIEW